MEAGAFDKLKRGDAVVVRFGSRGTQFGIVHHWDRRGMLHVCKWRENSGRWCHAIWTLEREIARPAYASGGPVTPIPAHMWRLKRGQLTQLVSLTLEDSI